MKYVYWYLAVSTAVSVGFAIVVTLGARRRRKQEQ